MTTPNWQHHSKKEKKRHLKPQALRQAKQRRQSLKRKLLAGALLVGASASPAQAVTWGEFWEPFREEHHHNHHHHRPRREMCRYRMEKERWVPGDRYHRGYLTTDTVIVVKPCGTYSSEYLW